MSLARVGSNLLNVTIEKETIVSILRDHKKQICGLQSKLLGAKPLFHEQHDA